MPVSPLGPFSDTEVSRAAADTVDSSHVHSMALPEPSGEDWASLRTEGCRGFLPGKLALGGAHHAPHLRAHSLPSAGTLSCPGPLPAAPTPHPSPPNPSQTLRSPGAPQTSPPQSCLKPGCPLRVALPPGTLPASLFRFLLTSGAIVARILLSAGLI